MKNKNEHEIALLRQFDQPSDERMLGSDLCGKIIADNEYIGLNEWKFFLKDIVSPAEKLEQADNQLAHSRFRPLVAPSPRKKEPSLDRLWGCFLVSIGLILLVAYFFLALFSKLLPPSHIPIISSFQNDWFRMLVLFHMDLH
ncbi:uncharacterized protein LOC131595745 isoform X2 [Vicia villosa]|uniref:uncharacterized protein LOC131595745 isoform X2 n=1 Tax=Vicia villosa TaxID=3911 RepID=UPI00273B2A6E|nr:uncharacterized protein LOC131595745 isoform X2 [Vicia villosa]